MMQQRLPLPHHSDVLPAVSRIAEQMAERMNSAVALRARASPSSRVRCSGGRLAMNILLATASRAWPRIWKFSAAANWSSYSVMLRAIAAKSGCGPSFEP
jgi:hypothetical protein